MNVLAIDPGPRDSAYCIWDGERISESNKIPSGQVCDMITACSQSTISSNWFDIVAVEHLQCFGMGVGKEVFDTAYWIGEMRQLCKRLQVTFVPVFRSQVKSHHCHSARATDSNIRYALMDRFGAKGTKKNPGLTYNLKGDLWSAFAIAVLVHDSFNEKTQAILI